MNEQQPPRRVLRSIGALLAGFVLVVVLSIGTDVALRATGVFPPLGQGMSDPLFLLATAYRVLCAVAGSYVTARLAPHSPMKHALAGGLVGLALSVVGAVTTWDRGSEFGPHWYPLALVATAIPCAWAGGRLDAWRRAGRPAR